MLATAGTSATAETETTAGNATTVGPPETAGKPGTLETPVAEDASTAIGTAATADFSHSRNSKNVNSGKNINISRMKKAQRQLEHQGGTPTTAGMSKTVETSVAEGMLARRQGQQQPAGSQNSRDHTMVGNRGLPMAARMLAIAEATGTPRDPSNVSRDTRNSWDITSSRNTNNRSAGFTVNVVFLKIVDFIIKRESAVDPLSNGSGCVSWRPENIRI
jgi:hypothetical protein